MAMENVKWIDLSCPVCMMTDGECQASAENISHLGMKLKPGEHFLPPLSLQMHFHPRPVMMVTTRKHSI